MAGDFNKHFFYPPPPTAIHTLHNLSTILKVQVKRTLDTESSQASTAAHMKMTLQKLCNQLQAHKAVIFEGVFSTLCCQRVCLSCIWQCCLLSVRKNIVAYQVHIAHKVQTEAFRMFALGAETYSESGTGGRRDGSEQGHEIANREGNEQKK